MQGLGCVLCILLFTSFTTSIEYTVWHTTVPSIISGLASSLPSQFTVLDVGAHHGQEAFVFADHGHRVISFEANERNVNVYKRVRRKWHNDTQLAKVYNLAVFSKDTLLTMNVPKVSAASHLTQVGKVWGAGSELPAVEKKEVEAVSLDSVVSRLGISHEKKIILKSDTEGCELEVVRGAKELLSSKALQFLILEFAPAALRGCLSRYQST